jgi:hypothetical protein
MDSGMVPAAGQMASDGFRQPQMEALMASDEPERIRTCHVDRGWD